MFELPAVYETPVVAELGSFEELTLGAGGYCCDEYGEYPYWY